MAGELRPFLSGILIPNSLAWSPDGRTMYFADSLLQQIFAYESILMPGSWAASG
ncbi:MAG: SMP-30/gluconolactonase/LRE family protein [Acetobacteraceae bacterium]|nr:SMP-30/gluconolactonase/LRE family protein [Acetobacteraceae bacterium]MBV8526066.1 SMP-30/gluconolactonase/LRE family protein [Acetobacteraceae bacterium]MBV8591283.1 SMP-30/gluconolactonase/LRE family protein [Acetobacteraceae bacterium]